MDLELPASIKCYDGAFDSETQRILDNQEKAMALIRAKEPDAHCTYFFIEQEYVVHVYGRAISAYTKSRGSALADAMNRLKIKGDSK